MTTVDSWPKTLPMMSVGSWNSTTETHLCHSTYKVSIYSTWDSSLSFAFPKWTFVTSSGYTSEDWGQPQDTLHMPPPMSQVCYKASKFWKEKKKIKGMVFSKASFSGFSPYLPLFSINLWPLLGDFHLVCRFDYNGA